MEHEHAICPNCKQEIVLTDNGSFALHNLPGWTKEDSADEIWFPIKCSMSNKQASSR